MKLNEQNSNGSLSVVIPKKIVEVLGWKAGQDVNWEQLTSECLLLCSSEKNQQDLDQFFEHIQIGLHSIKQMKIIAEQVASGMDNVAVKEEAVRAQLKAFLGLMLTRI